MKIHGPTETKHGRSQSYEAAEASDKAHPSMHYYKEVPDCWESLLEKSIYATHDYDYIRSCIFRGIDNPFFVRSARHVDAAVLNAALLGIPQDKLEPELWVETVDEKIKFNFLSPVEREPRAIGGTRMATTRKQETQLCFKKVVFATVGGAFLAGPMRLMVFVKTQYASLISTWVFVFAAGLLAAWKIDDPIAVLSATATYAAVLIMFFGTITAPTTSLYCRNIID